MKKYSFFISIALILSSCESVYQPAPIIFHHKDAGKNTTNQADSKQDLEKAIKTDEQVATEIIIPRGKKNNNGNYIVPAKLAQNPNYKIIYHEVQIGENIEDIAIKYGKNVKEITKLNNLLYPYNLEEFEILKIRVRRQNNPEQRNDHPPISTQLDPFSKVINLQNSSNFIQPVRGTIITKFNANTPHGPNKGINIAAKIGSEVLAVGDGKIIYADYDAIFGNLILMKIKAQNKIISYAHMKNINTKKGAEVTQGEVIGYVGNSGRVDTPQLHFGIREGKEIKNPEEFVKF